MPARRRYLSLALPVPLHRHFDYLPPPDFSPEQIAALQPGVRVEVPFGKQTLVGVLLAVRSGSDIADDKIKHAHCVLDAAPVVPAALLALVHWSAAYYQHPEGDALLSVLPALLRDGHAASRKTETWWRLTTHGKGLPEGALKRSAKQALLLQALQQQGELSQHAAEALGISRAIIRELEKKQLVEAFGREVALSLSAHPRDTVLAESPLALNREQHAAVEQIGAARGFQSFLLQGVTGSGKTEVYLQVIDKVLQRRQQALVLVPEIGLTPQTVDRFRRRFAVPVVAFHSGLNHRERLDAWLQAARHEAAIVIGTRSAVFTPLAAPGVIIVDEEHDTSFKQQDGFRYHARDVAVVRAQRERIPVVLGSATPSLETLNNALRERYGWLRLGERAGAAAPPRLVLVDTSRQAQDNGLSADAVAALRETLVRGEQALVFLNRRGYAPVLVCADCGWIASCPHCDARLTVHRRLRQLRCHYCDRQQPLPRHCAQCHSPRLDALGQGTQRSEEKLTALFPDWPVLRIDRDSMGGREAFTRALDTVQRGEPAVLVGTQMLAKGHHFPNVTLVVIVDADSGLFSSDFRSAERTAQLLTQVAGRAGRADKPGLVLVQTRFPAHPLLQSLHRGDYEALALALLDERRTLALPPFRQQALLRTEARDPAVGRRVLQALRDWLETQAETAGVQVIGPVPALMEKRAGLYRNELVFFAERRPALQALLPTLLQHAAALPDAKKTRLAVDVDPV